jgi:indolepyruvate ferredoxin oxidoreductase
MWCAYTAGVGGMGSGVVTAILAQAGLRQGYNVLFADKKGLAIRNGGVYGHVVFASDGKPRPPLVPYGRADLLLGLDLLEAARALDEAGNQRAASKDRTAAVVNLHKTPTVRTLMGLDAPKPDELAASLKRSVRMEGSLFLDFARMSETYFGDSLYANVIMLGAAWQKGLMPLSWENLLEGVRRSVPTPDIDGNVKALDIGRRAAVRPDLFEPRSTRRTFREMVDDKAFLLEKNRPLVGRRLAADYRKIVIEAGRWMDLPEPERIKLAQYIYDLMMFEGTAFARRFLEKLWAVYRRDDVASRGRAATRAVLDSLPRMMIIKDEVYVAGLLTSEEKYRRDRDRYDVDPSRGDRVSYVHLNRPRFVFLGKTIEFDWNSRPWQLKIMRGMRFLRRFMPGWHAEERAFRSWYEGIVDGFQPFSDEGVYRSYVELLRLPEKVKGYREVRSQGMADARARAADLQKKLPPRRVEVGSSTGKSR